MFHSYFISYDSIDRIIGADASKWNGYYFLILFWYPVLVAVYMIIMWLIDVQIQKNILNQNLWKT
jgi:hypothetical protein